MSGLQHNSSQARRRMLLVLLLALGIGLSAWQPVSAGELLAWGREIATRPMFIALVLLAMITMFAFGLPGSLGMWVIAPFLPPLLAISLLLLASVVGALSAYRVGRHLGGAWQPGTLSHRVIGLLQRQGGLLTQTALRVLPGFPHVAINFPAGFLRLPILTFVVAAVLGLGPKWTVYVLAIQGIVDTLESGGGIRFSVLAPLVALSLLLLGGHWLKHRLTAG
jgi:uncharacterized membrane protein YdjX (TVP38/TMEM64 family)